MGCRSPTLARRKFGREWSGAGGRDFYFRAALQRGAGSGAVCHGSCRRGPVLAAKAHPGGRGAQPGGGSRSPGSPHAGTGSIPGLPRSEPGKGRGSPQHLVREGRHLSLCVDGETEALSQKVQLLPGSISTNHPRGLLLQLSASGAEDGAGLCSGLCYFGTGKPKSDKNSVRPISVSCIKLFLRNLCEIQECSRWGPMSPSVSRAACRVRREGQGRNPGLNKYLWWVACFGVRRITFWALEGGSPG